MKKSETTRMRLCAAAIVLAGAVLATARANPIPAPDDWRKESFTFPLGFAPKVPYEGTEYLRFSPDWERFAEDGAFTYVFVWDVKAKPVTPEDVEEYLEFYFDGLMNNVGNARKVVDGRVKATVAAHPMTGIPGWSQALGVQVRTWNAFSKGEALLLHGEVAHRDCGAGRMQIFFAFSKSRRDRPVWEALRAARKGTTCDPGGKP
jgi:hypothetical protein